MTPEQVVKTASDAESLGIVGMLICFILLLLAVLCYLVRHYVKHYKELIEKNEQCQQRVRRLELAIADLASSEDIESVRRKAHNIVEHLSR